MPSLAFAAQAIVVFLMAAASASGVSALAYPLVAPKLDRLAPDRRAYLLGGAACVPAAVGAGFLALAVLPKIAGFFGAVDHCMTHGHHPHLCPVHPWPGGPSLMGAAVLLMVAVALIASCRRVLRAMRALRAIKSLSDGMEHDGTLRVRSPRPFAFTAGLARPRVYVSTGLRESVSAVDLAIVVEHERAHARRRDALARLVAGFFGRLHLPMTQRRLARALHLACEQACDDASALRVGDRLKVAAALVEVEKLQDGAEPWPSVAFGGSDVAARVEALLAPAVEHRPAPRLPVWFVVATSICLLATLSDPLHHAAETIVAFLSR